MVLTNNISFNLAKLLESTSQRRTPMQLRNQIKMISLKSHIILCLYWTVQNTVKTTNKDASGGAGSLFCSTYTVAPDSPRMGIRFIFHRFRRNETCLSGISPLCLLRPERQASCGGSVPFGPRAARLKAGGDWTNCRIPVCLLRSQHGVASPRPLTIEVKVIIICSLPRRWNGWFLCYLSIAGKRPLVR